MPDEYHEGTDVGADRRGARRLAEDIDRMYAGLWGNADRDAPDGFRETGTEPPACPECGMTLVFTTKHDDLFCMRCGETRPEQAPTVGVDGDG